MPGQFKFKSVLVNIAAAIEPMPGQYSRAAPTYTATPAGNAPGDACTGKSGRRLRPRNNPGTQSEEQINPRIQRSYLTNRRVH